ncbi:MAG: nuclear transport factor 2 family protein [Acidimicrobiales bacterium]
MTSPDIESLASAFFEAVEAGDLDKIRSIYAPDVVVWHNYDKRAQTLEENLRVLKWMVANVSDRRYEDIRRLVVDDGFVQQHVLTGIAPSGARLDVPAMMRVWVSEGCVTRIDEYLDSAQVSVLT